jgi:hypothetical protein
MYPQEDSSRPSEEKLSASSYYDPKSVFLKSSKGCTNSLNLQFKSKHN